ncbi:GyrI-like domain-containing protein [Clostridium sp. MB05]|uniref:AraC family transcriptional regulator n=1 Tax=Clostridium sp. MB05 TaxID=3376682 RepID=UPI00398260E6
MDIRIEKIKKCRVAYVRGVGPYGASNIQVMANLKKWAEEKNLFDEEAIIYGIPQDNPQITAPKDCRYDACIVISNDYQIDDSINEAELNAGEYAVYKIKHTEEDIKKAWKEIFINLENAGYKIDNKPTIERYSNDMVNKGYCEICVPIKKL